MSGGSPFRCRRLEVGAVAGPRGDQVRADVLVVPARAEQVGQQPVRPLRPADHAADHLRRLVRLSGLATGTAASSRKWTLCQTLSAMDCTEGLTCPRARIVMTAWLSAQPARRTCSVAAVSLSSFSRLARPAGNLRVRHRQSRVADPRRGQQAFGLGLCIDPRELARAEPNRHFVVPLAVARRAPGTPGPLLCHADHYGARAWTVRMARARTIRVAPEGSATHYLAPQRSRPAVSGHITRSGR
jgi:hypothetical protein